MAKNTPGTTGAAGAAAGADANTTPTEATELAVVVPNLFAGLDLEELGFTEEELKTLTGLDQIGTGEVRIPYSTLINKDGKTPTGEVLKKGDIVFADDTIIHGTDGEAINDISILKVQPVRVMFPTPFNPNNDFICRSINGEYGHDDGKYAGQKCSECEFSKYPEAGGSSPCRDQRLLLCTKSDGGLFHIQVGGVGVGVWKTFMSAQLFHILPKARNVLGAFKLKMGSKIVDTSFGPFAALDFKLDQKDPFVTKTRLADNLNSYKAYKEFEKVYAETAALQTKVSMAAGQEEVAGDGKNASLF